VFSGVIFKESIGSFRTAMAQSEIMRKLRVITEQLDSDFKGLQKDGFLLIRSAIINRSEYFGAVADNFRADRIYFFTTGEFQSWVDPDRRSNIARIYFTHDNLTLIDAAIPVNRWRFLRDAQLLTPGYVGPDFNDISYAWIKANPALVFADVAVIPDIDVANNPPTIRRLLYENAGQLKIDWTDNTKDPNGAIAWFGLEMPRSVGDTFIPPDARYADPTDPVETFSPFLYSATWIPSTLQELWPKAIRFTFTLYDSKGVFKNGQTFTHIVYLGD
jgi:hypothetical protein